MTKTTTTATIAALALAAGAASADTILSWGFTDLNGSFSTDTSTFNAHADNTLDVSTTGDVTRLADPGATADYGAGFYNPQGTADVQLTLSVDNIAGLTADGAGSFVITDADGDVLAGDIVDGQWVSPGFGVMFFNAHLEHVAFDQVSQDGLFNGPSGGSFDMDLPGEAPYEGAFIQLFIETDGGFFSGDFSDISVQANGEIIPTPGSMAMLGLGGLCALRRRRNR